MTLPRHLLISRTGRACLIAGIVLGCLANASAQTFRPNDTSYRENLSTRSSAFYSDAFFTDSFSARPWFSLGPNWLMNAMSGSHVSNLRPLAVANRDGDRTESVYRYASDVGTLANPFEVALFNSVSFASAGGGAPKSRTVLTVAPDSVPTPYYFGGGNDVDWGSSTSWGPGTGYPNGAGDSAINLQEVTGSVVQNVVGGVTVGIINNNPTTPGNSAQNVSWTITTNTSITMDSGSTSPAQINNSQTVGTSTLTINSGIGGGLVLATDLTVTNANATGLVTISAPISGAHNVAVGGIGTTIFSGTNTYSGTTTIDTGTLNAASASALGGTSAVTVNTGGTLLFSGNTTDRINDAAMITLAGGTLNTAGLSEGTPTSPGMGALTLTSASTIDLGTVASVLAFADSHLSGWTGALRILNWSGSLTGDGTDQVYFGTNSGGLTTAQLNQISFYSDGGSTLLGTAAILADGEIIPALPIPEPSTWIGGAMAFGAIVFVSRRRLRSVRV